MLEYAFFHPTPCGLFCDFLKEKGLEPRLEQEDLSTNVLLPEELDDALLEEIEVYYDELLDMTEELTAGQDGDEYIHSVGVAVNLKDGRSVLAAIPPALVNKLLATITLEELSDLVNAVVDAVENPDLRPLCKR
ncbi:MAG: hypothetical protein KJ558_02605 [Gammaproteobacteria bacterium]|nr:hypothetical protein [Gammaproteobacteria bacterium]MBU1653716.1 hypothetical protein [Gammaproteobacteria bacterium]MBU1960884.1 hypothetical protein [Gammaproteobacteria bacterium]